MGSELNFMMTEVCVATNCIMAKSYDDRDLCCYQLYNDGGGWSYQ